MQLVICNNTKDNFLQEPEKIHFKFHRNWENTGKIVMRKISFCEIWGFWSLFSLAPIECFHSRGEHLFKFIGAKESVCIRKEYNSQRIGLGHQHGRRFIVLGHQYGRRDVMWKHSIRSFSSELFHTTYSFYSPWKEWKRMHYAWNYPGTRFLSTEN